MYTSHFFSLLKLYCILYLNTSLHTRYHLKSFQYSQLNSIVGYCNVKKGLSTMWTPHILCQPIWGVFTFRQDCSKTSCIEKLIEPEFTTKLNEWRSCILHRMYCFCSVWLGIDIGISICIGIGVGIVHLDIAIGICIVSVVYALALAILSFWLGCRETKPPYY